MRTQLEWKVNPRLACLQTVEHCYADTKCRLWFPPFSALCKLTKLNFFSVLWALRFFLTSTSNLRQLLCFGVKILAFLVNLTAVMYCENNKPLSGASPRLEYSKCFLLGPSIPFHLFQVLSGTNQANTVE